MFKRAGCNGNPEKSPREMGFTLRVANISVDLFNFSLKNTFSQKPPVAHLRVVKEQHGGTN